MNLTAQIKAQWETLRKGYSVKEQQEALDDLSTFFLDKSLDQFSDMELDEAGYEDDHNPFD